MSIEYDGPVPDDRRAAPQPPQSPAPAMASAMTKDEQAILDKLLIEAVTNRDLGHIRTYVEKGANVNISAGDVSRYIRRNGNDEYYTANAPLIHQMYAKGLKTDIADFLIAEGADIDSRDARGNTMLMLAAKTGDISAATYFVSKGADVFAKNHNGEIVLDVARNLTANYHQNRQNFIDVLVGALPDMLRDDMAQGNAVTPQVIASANENKPDKPRIAPRTASFSKATPKPKPHNNKLNL
ncbi:MAG: ankyrin repeat domain-containing protein [bacterium]|nr:ankyrin repeat domain-containing protein [bacterium]